jgi:hypothetical protein
MLIFDVQATASYKQYRNRTRLMEDAQNYFAVPVTISPYTDRPDTLRFAFPPLENGAVQTVTQNMCDAFMSQHNNSIQTNDQLIDTQTQSAKNSLITQLNFLVSLPAEDAGYAMMGRAMAYKDGATLSVINSIVNRATAVSYLQSKPEWTNLPVASKNWIADQLDMESYLFQVLIVALRG